MREQLERIRTFLAEVVQEARRITWPRPREVAGATLVVLIAGVIVATLLFLYDGVIGFLLQGVLR